MPGRLYGAVAPFPNPVDDPSNSYIFSGGRGTGKGDRRDVASSSSSPPLGTLSSDEDDESTALIAATADAGVTAAVTAETSGAAVATETSATDAIELRVRATRDGARMAGERPPPLADVVFLEREVREGDSLVTFALQYGCSVSDIKRANNLMSEQGMYALRSVRIPVRRHGLLTDAVEEARRRPLPPPSSSSTTSSLPATAGASVATGGSSLPTARLAAVPAPPSPMASPAEVAATAAAVAFLRVMDRDIANIARRTDVSKASLEEVTQALTEKRFHPLGPRQHLHQLEFRQDNHQQQQLEGSSHHRRRKDSCDGADCGIRWWSAVAVMLLVGVAMPLVYYAFHAVRARLDSPAPLAGEDDPAAAAAAAAAAAEAGGIPGKGEQQRQGQQHERQQQQVRRLVSRFHRAPIELRSTPDGTLPTVASKQIPAASG
ncbi:uncharacterized protein LOC116953499 [Petromyzon marinus]|uniref:uncharacterized protein LOC116953499 n=1 Tax=Petromyzon marinus TaxID=7757 RepID=UPI003F707B32